VYLPLLVQYHIMLSILVTYNFSLVSLVIFIGVTMNLIVCLLHRFEWPSDQEAARLATWSAARLEKAEFAPLDLQYVAIRRV
jgi:hypothetical protein